MDTPRKSYTSEFKLKVVLESMQRDTTQEEVCKRFGISSSMLHRWRKEFQANAAGAFFDKRDPKQKAQAQGYAPGESPDDLKKIIGELTVQNAHPKKSFGAVEQIKTAHKVELAHQVCRPHGPYSKSQVARALGIARGTLYLKGKQAVKDKQVATAIERWHEHDDTLGHRKLAVLLTMGKNRVKRVMNKYGIAARCKKKRYVYPGKASTIVPNLLREPQENVQTGTSVSSSNGDENSTPVQKAEAEVVFSDIFEVSLADRTKVRGCFALWKRTRHILSLAFDYRMQAELVVSTIEQMPFDVPGSIFHSDQGSQYGAEQTRAALLAKGFVRSMSRAGTPTDNGYAERFVGTFKQAVAERQRYRTLGHFLEAAEKWINFYNHLRPHEGIGNCSPDQFASIQGLPEAPYLPLL